MAIKGIGASAAQVMRSGVHGLPDARKRLTEEQRKREKEKRNREQEKRRRDMARAERARKRAEEQRKKDEELKKRRKPFDRAMSRTRDGQFRRKEDGSYAVNTGRRFV